MTTRQTSPPEEDKPQDPVIEEKKPEPVKRKAPAKKTTAKKESTKTGTAKNDNPQADKKLRRKPSPINGAVLPAGKQFKAGEEAREKGRKGGKKSGEVRRARKTLREELLDLLSVTTKDSNGKERTRQESMSLALLMKAMRGDVRAYETIRDTIGERPKEQHEVSVAVPRFESLDDAFSKLSGDSL